MVRIESFADVEDYVQEAIAKLAQSLETRFGAEIQGARGAMEAAVKKELQDQASARIDLESRLAGTQQALEDAVRTLGEIQGGLMPMLEPRLFQIEQLHRGLEKNAYRPRRRQQRKQRRRVRPPLRHPQVRRPL